VIDASRLGAWPIVAVAVVTLAACGGESSGPVSLSDGDPVRGQELFAMHCAACHGEDMLGTDAGPPFLHQVYVPSHHADQSFLLAVRNGVIAHHWDFGPMPAMPQVTDDEVAHIVAHVRQEQRRAGVIE
jgi:cytochrome c